MQSWTPPRYLINEIYSQAMSTLTQDRRNAVICKDSWQQALELIKDPNNGDSRPSTMMNQTWQQAYHWNNRPSYLSESLQHGPGKASRFHVRVSCTLKNRHCFTANKLFAVGIYYGHRTSTWFRNQTVPGNHVATSNGWIWRPHMTSNLYHPFWICIPSPELQMFSRIDFVKGYHQVPMHPEMPFGLIESLFMSFWLINTTQTFQRLMDCLIGHFPFLVTYLDDHLIVSRTLEEHIDHLSQFFIFLQENGLTINPTICSFVVMSVVFLGHMYSEDGLVPLPRYVAATIQSFPPPQAIKELSVWWILLWVPSLSWANSQATDWPAPRQSKTLEWPPAATDAFEATKVTQTIAAVPFSECSFGIGGLAPPIHTWGGYSNSPKAAPGGRWPSFCLLRSSLTLDRESRTCGEPPNSLDSFFTDVDDQKRFIYILLTRHGCLPVWLVAAWYSSGSGHGPTWN